GGAGSSRSGRPSGTKGEGRRFAPLPSSTFSLLPRGSSHVSPLTILSRDPQQQRACQRRQQRGAEDRDLGGGEILRRRVSLPGDEQRHGERSEDGRVGNERRSKQA